MATGARGEGYLDLDGETFAVLFTNRALAEAERQIGKGILQISGAMRADTISLGELAQLLAVGLEAARKESRSRPQSYTVNDAYGLLDRVGFGEIAILVYQAVAAVLGYKRTREDGENPPE